MAWVDSTKQFNEKPNYNFQSQLTNTNLIGYCLSADDFRRDLLPGKNCTYDTQCLSSSCNILGICAGKTINEPCSETNECNIGLACISDKKWPFGTNCKELLGEND